MRRWPLLHDAQRRVLRELIIHGAGSRVDIAGKLDLSRASLTRIVRELVDLGFLTEGAAQHIATRGRPRELIHLRPEAAQFVGVKLTGDHAYVVLTDLGATVVAEAAERLDDRDPERVADQILRMAAPMLDAAPLPAALGVALAGTVSERDGTSYVEHSHFLGWEATPFADILAARTPLPITITNDVVALTGAHHWFGAGVGHESLVVYGLGAGIGCGLVVLDEVVTGAHGRSGHVGHARMGVHGARCESGHTDCVHSFVTMGAIEHNAGVAYPVALERARAGEDRASAAFRLAARALGISIAENVNAIDPEKVLVTGEGVDMMELAPDELRDALAEHLEQVDPASVVIERPAFSFAHYARGAAIAAMRDLV